MVPAGIVAPLGGLLTDRYPRRDIVLGGLVSRTAVLVAIGLAVAASGPFVLVLILAALFTSAAATHKPAQAALLPALAETPQQLAACNVVSNGLDNAAFLIGALLSGGLIAAAGVRDVFFVTGALFALAAIPTALIGRDPVPEFRQGDELDLRHEVVEGFRAVAGDRSLRLIVGLRGISTLVEGAIDGLVVVVAIRLLGLGGSGVGWLNACWGFGGLVGGAGALNLLGRGRLAGGLAGGCLLVGVPLMLIGAVASLVVTPAMLILLGLGYALVEVAATSLLQRLTSNDLLGRVFAVTETSYWITTGLGAVLAPVVIHLLGVKGALIAVGAALPLVALWRWYPLSRLEAGVPVPVGPFNAIRKLSMFSPLPLAMIENVSRLLDEISVPAGTTVIHEGDHGDRFYVVVEGLLDVTCERGAFPSVGAGEFFGEIALLHDVPRTATVTARDDSVLLALDRESFLLAVAGHAYSTRSVGRVAAERLARVPVA
jgi:predicted MFS family arabinose efflux permease